MQYTEFVERVAKQAGDLSREHAEALTGATLITLAERISGGESQDLAAQLPAELQEPLTGAEEAAEAFSFEAFLDRVRGRARLDAEGIDDRVRAVFAILGQAVTSGELDDVVSHLPREYRDALGVTG